MFGGEYRQKLSLIELAGRFVRRISVSIHHVLAVLLQYPRIRESAVFEILDRI